jgi:hypothetical protein
MTPYLKLAELAGAAALHDRSFAANARAPAFAPNRNR